MYARKQTTVAQIEAYAAKTREDFAGQGFTIQTNSHGLRAECDTCHESATLNPEMWMRRHGHAATGRTADFEETTLNADGTRNRVLYFA